MTDYRTLIDNDALLSGVDKVLRRSDIDIISLVGIKKTSGDAALRAKISDIAVSTGVSDQIIYDATGMLYNLSLKSSTNSQGGFSSLRNSNGDSYTIGLWQDKKELMILILCILVFLILLVLVYLIVIIKQKHK